MRRFWVILAATASTVFTPLAAAAEPASSCQMLQLGELPVTLVGRTPLIEVSINGHPAKMLVDTGAQTTLLFTGAAETLGLAVREVPGVKFYGVGGGSSAYSARIAELDVGGLTARNFDVFVAGRKPIAGAVGLVGAAFLLQMDLELDFPDGKIRFLKPKNCLGDQVVYWRKAYSVAPLLPTNNGQSIQTHVFLDGAQILAELDTGANISVVTNEAAERAGVTPSGVGVTPGGSSTGLGPQKVQTVVATFSTFSFGDETIKNARIRIAPLFNQDTEVPLGSRLARRAIDAPDMLLGSDFLRSHRVYVAQSQGKIYVSYVGGPVFELHRPRGEAPPAGVVGSPPSTSPPTSGTSSPVQPSTGPS